MRTVPADWASIIAGSHKAAVEAHLYGPDGSYVTALDLVGGSVSLDGTAAVRASCDLSLSGIEWVPVSATDRLAPYGPEVNVLKGYEAAGVKTLVSLGWFGIEDCEVSDDGQDLTVRVTGMDRARRLQYALLEDDVQIASGTPFTEAILTLGYEAWPDMPVMDGFDSVSDLSIGVPLNAAQGDDRWEQMQSLAVALGMSLFFDGDGLLTLRPYVPGDPVAEVVDGENGVLVQASRAWTRANAFNKVIFTGENTTASGDVFRGEALDNDPLSPTYYYGPFGRCPQFFSSPYVASDSQAESAAAAKLFRELGTASSVSFGMVPNPALEPDDAITVRRVRAGINEVHTIDSLSIDLGVDGSMSGATREVLVTA